MSVLQAVILGVIQGLTEFLPVSSSGHLALAQRLFNIQEPAQTFDIVLHLGTLLPVIIIFWGKIWSLIKKPFQKTMLALIIGTVPAVLAALFLDDFISNLFGGIVFLPLFFIITGIFLIISDKIKKGYKKEIGYVEALIIGCFQAFAIPPGISRSGSTITGALIAGADRNTAAEFSFLLSIPAILGAAVLAFKDVLSTGGENIDILIFGAGFVASALSGYLAISFMLELIKKAKLRYFSIYVFALAIFTFVLNTI